MKERCAVVAAMETLANAGGNSNIGTDQVRPKTFECQVDRCPVVAHIEKRRDGVFHIATEDAHGTRLGGFCRKWCYQSIVVD